MAFCLDCFFFRVGWDEGRDRDCHRIRLCPSFSAMKSAVINTRAKVASLPFTVSGSTDHWTHIDFGTAWTMDSDMVSGVSLCHGPQRVLLWQYRLQTSTWPSAAVDHWQQHGPQLSTWPQVVVQLFTSTWPPAVAWPTHINMATAAVGEWTQTWPLVAAWITDSNMASFSNLEHGH